MKAIAGDCLPRLLTFPSAIDTLILSAQIVVPSAESMAEVASDVLKAILSTELKELLCRLHEFKEVRDTLSKTERALYDIDDLNLKLVRNRMKLSLAAAREREDLRLLEKEAAAVWPKLSRFPEVNILLVFISHHYRVDCIFSSARGLPHGSGGPNYS